MIAVTIMPTIYCVLTMSVFVSVRPSGKHILRQVRDTSGILGVMCIKVKKKAELSRESL